MIVGLALVQQDRLDHFASLHRIDIVCLRPSQVKGLPITCNFLVYCGGGELKMMLKTTMESRMKSGGDDGDSHDDDDCYFHGDYYFHDDYDDFCASDDGESENENGGGGGVIPL